jgi:hypothetical protein
MAEKDNRIENILVMLLLNSMKGESMANKALSLNKSGFTNVEIADFLETSAAVISQTLYSIRKTTKKKK